MGHGIPGRLPAPETGRLPSALPTAMVRAGAAAMVGFPPAAGREPGARRLPRIDASRIQGPSCIATCSFPVDDTDLSIEVVGNAVALARALGARITFFHAVADAARLAARRGRGAAPDRARANTNTPISARRASCWPRPRPRRARSACRASSRHVVSDKPAQAIVAAARAARLRPDLHGVARSPRQARHGTRVRDAGSADERRPAGAGVVDRRAGSAGAGDRHHPRRAPLAGRGDARLDARPRRGAREAGTAPIRR